GAGSAAATSSLCREPTSDAVGDLKNLGQDVITAQDKLVTSIAAGAATPSQIVQQIAVLDRQWQSLDPQIAKIVQGSGQISLFVAGGVAVTGLNRLSYNLQRLGR